MVDYKYKDLFYDRSVKKSLRIYNDDETLVLTNSDIHYESFELTESISSEQNLVFGSCEPSMVKFRVSNIVTSLKNQWLTVSETLEGGADEPFLFGRYKVFSDELTSDRKYRDITAYDALHDALEVDLTTWYNTILPNDDSEVTQKQFRDSLFEFLGIEQEDIALPNDDMIIQKTIQPEQIYGYDVLTALCEINGCFGHIGRDGKFQYIFLKEMKKGLYPSDTLYPSNDLFPSDGYNVERIKKAHYISAEYEDFTTAKINKLRIRQEEDDIGATYPPGDILESDNVYVVQDNFLVYGKGTEELEEIAANMLSVICNVWYRPAHVVAKGNPCLEVGDGIKLGTSSRVVYTYIMQRTLKGIQALRDTYDAEGEQYQREEVNSTQKSIIQLKGKTNKLTRTIEETKLEMADIEKGLSSSIKANASSIEAEVRRANAAEGILSTHITQNATSINFEVGRAKSAEEQLLSKIMQTADELRFEVTERTSMYNEEVNTIQGGMDGNIDASFFSNSISDVIVTTIEGKQCISSGSHDPINGTGLSQDVSLPAGTYLFSYEWLRTSGLYKTADLKLLNLTSGEVIYSKDLGTAWPETGVWHEENHQFTIEKTTRVRFDLFYVAPIGYPERENDVYLTNIALYGTAQSVADAITDMKSELMLQSDQISLKVSKNEIISEINQTAEAVTIKASKIDLEGLVSATEFTSKFATIQSLSAVSAMVNRIDADYASVDWVNANFFTAYEVRIEFATIASLNAVDAKFSSISADNIKTGTMSADRIDADSLGSKVVTVLSGKVVSVNSLSASGIINANGGLTINGYDAVRKSATIGGVTINYWGWE